ncbi:MAG: DUF3754 domain-containing protein, partial [Planctomycetes bacterium]|nr:DUF3754 domain-containing protein [Planctomycetota bacterium]
MSLHIPANREAIVRALLARESRGPEKERLRACLALLEELIHHRWHKEGRACVSLYSDIEAGKSNQSEALIEKVEELLTKANFEMVERAELDYALESKQLLDLPLQIDWKSFEREPLIAYRGRSTRTERGRYFMRKLPSYMIHGALGVMVCSLFVAALGVLLFIYTERRDARLAISGSPSFESSETIGPGQRESFRIDLEDHEAETPIRWSLSDNEASDGSEILQLTSEGSRAWVNAPESIVDDRSVVILRATLPNEDAGDALLERALVVQREYSPLPLYSSLRNATWALLGLGGLGFMVGLGNLVRKRKWNEERRAKAREKSLSALQARTKAETARLRVDRFKDLFRVESFTTDVLERVVLAFRLKSEARPMLKLFRDIPLADLELVLPATKLRMKFRDRLLLGFSILGALVVVIIKVIAIVSAAFVALWFLAMAFLSAGGVAARTWGKFRNLTRRYQSTLTES